MKRLSIFIAVALAVAAGIAQPLAQDKTSKAGAPKLSKREITLRRTGGMLEDRRTKEGQFAFINMQKKVPTSAFENLVVGTMRQFFRTDFVLIPCEGKFTMTEAVACREKADSQVAVFLIDDPAFPTLITAPEGRWAAVNAAALSADNPSEEILGRRFCREMWRSLALLCATGSTREDICVMQPVQTLKELDDLKALALSQEYLMRSRMVLPNLGVKPTKRATYRQACEEGWAPAPTNEYQKAIWEKVKGK